MSRYQQREFKFVLSLLRIRFEILLHGTELKVEVTYDHEAILQFLVLLILLHLLFIDMRLASRAAELALCGEISTLIGAVVFIWVLRKLL